MYLLIRFPVGIIVEGIVLAKGKNRMRVVAAGFTDTVELRRSARQWFAENGQPVEFDFLMSNTNQAEIVSSSRSADFARVAGAAATQN